MNVRNAALALGALVLATAPAFAQPVPGEEEALRTHCTGDYMRLCSQFDPGSREIEQCFKAHMRELTPNCRTAINYYTKQHPRGRAR